MKFKESSTLELKQIIVPDIRKEIIAFANSNGGTIYVGVEDAIRAMIIASDGESYETSHSLRQDLTFASIKNSLHKRE